MKQTIVIKRSSVAGRIPSELQAGELAVNLADNLLYTADTSGNIITLNAAATPGNSALKVASGSGTTTEVITMNEGTADKTLTVTGDGTYLTGAVSGSAGAPTVTISHADPTADPSSEITAAISGSAGEYAKDTEYTVLTGVKAQRDAKGHITGLTYSAQKVKDTNTEYTKGSSSDLNTGTDRTGKIWDAKTISDFVGESMANATRFRGGFNAETGAIDGGETTLTSVEEKIGDVYVATTAGTFVGTTMEVGDSIIFKKSCSAGTAPTSDHIIFVEGTVSVDNKDTMLAWSTATTVATVEGTDITVSLPANPNTDTKVTSVSNHYTPSGGTTKSASGASGTSGTTVQVVTGVTCDAAGHVTGITSGAATDSSVTSVSNHYTPTGTSTKSASGASGTSGSTVQVVTGVTVDAAGHVTGITSGAATDTTYESKTAASGGTDRSLVTTGEKYTWNNKSNLTLGNTSSTALAGNTKYAGASTQGGAATSAEKLTNTSNIGNTNQPVYFTASGVPTAISYTIDKSVPSNAVFTDNSVTSTANHYAPATVSGQDKSASASGGTASWSIDVVKGVTLNTDGKGHVTGLSVTSAKLPANPVSSSTVTGTGLKVDKIVVGNEGSKVKTSDKGITATAPSSSSDDSTVPTSKAVWTAVSNGIATADAMIYKGTVAGGSTDAYGALTPAASKGWTYKVTTAGKIDGKAVEIGDMLICNTDGTAAATSSNYSTIAANWDFIQVNIDGAVTGPASSTDAHVAVFNGATGKVIKDSGFTIAKSVPSNAVFTDTTYSSKSAASGGTDVSLVTTGEKYTWNNKSNLTLGNTASTALAGNTKYAGSSTQGGAATSAEKLTNTSNIGNTNQPVYFTTSGVPAAISYTINKSVPSNAVFTDTNTKVTSVDNHYTPSENTSSQLDADASSTTAATWNSTSLVTGVTVKRDAKGHVVGLGVDSIKMPGNPNTDIKVRQTLTSDNWNLPLLMAYQQNTVTSANVDNTTYRNNSIYANPSEGTITAKLKGNIYGQFLRQANVETGSAARYVYVKLGTFNYNSFGTLCVHLEGNAIKDELYINYGSGNATAPLVCGWYASNSVNVKEIDIVYGTSWSDSCELWLRVYQSATLNIAVFRTIRGDGFIVNTAANWSATTTSPTFNKKVPLIRGMFGDLSGNASSASKLTTNAGSATQPVYFKQGVPTACSYQLNKTVPSNAVFTDTTYSSKSEASGGTDVSLVTTGEKYTWNHKSNLALGNTSSTALAGNTKYAGSSTQGGAATSAEKLTNTSNIGNTNQPVYFTTGGVPTAISYTINKSVPSNAVFTDTTYAKGTSSNLVTGTDQTGKVWDAKTISDYVGSMVTNATHFKGGFNASTGAIDGGSSTMTSVAEKIGDVYTATTAGTFAGTAMEVGDSIIFKADCAAGTAPTSSYVIFVEGTVSVVNNGATLAWGKSTTVATVEGTNINVSLPGNPNTDTKVTSTANHYTPATVSGQDKSASASGGTAGWSIDVVKGVTLNTDGKGHVTGLSVTSAKIPANPNTDTKVTQRLFTRDGLMPLLFAAGQHNDTTADITDITYRNNSMYVLPSQGWIFANRFVGNLEGNLYGTAYEASKLTTNAGSATQPVYFSGGVPTACSYQLNKTVPSNAVFTDTTYSSKSEASGGTDVSLVTTGEKYTWNHKSNLALGNTSSTALAGNTKYAGSSTQGGAATSAEKLTNTSNIGNTNQPVYFTTSGVPTAISYTINKSVPSNAVFTDTHYTTHLYAGSGTAANAATGNGNTKLTVVDNTTTRNSVTIKGTGGTTVTSDKNGVVTINSTDVYSKQFSFDSPQTGSQSGYDFIIIPNGYNSCPSGTCYFVEITALIQKDSSWVTRYVKFMTHCKWYASNAGLRITEPVYTYGYVSNSPIFYHNKAEGADVGTETRNSNVCIIPFNIPITSGLAAVNIKVEGPNVSRCICDRSYSSWKWSSVEPSWTST